MNIGFSLLNGQTEANQTLPAEDRRRNQSEGIWLRQDSADQDLRTWIRNERL